MITVEILGIVPEGVCKSCKKEKSDLLRIKSAVLNGDFDKGCFWRAINMHTDPVQPSSTKPSSNSAPAGAKA